MAYRKEEQQRIIGAGYEFYDITNEKLQESVKNFIETHPWAKKHANLVFAYIRVLTDFKVLSELDKPNDIRLRNSLVTSIDKLHKQLFSYEHVEDGEGKNNGEDDMSDLFNPTGNIRSIRGK